ncbi:hypothetical protein [Actinoallomurus iriomotensis]|uniref:DUF2690 domain-containing protein n=1 Tax=Actinoallomurus iriomotensis TaxID=478107 RepID=A0A9W6VUB5_9ACTN|nr:hypothetical protein [Actinoallomurus iriomotensis]GLY78516.1 hypothetical protein Airi01_067830 [Actinoallomurus iriomotensis]
MELKAPRRISALIAATAIGGGMAATAFAVSASADTGSRAGANSMAGICAKAHGKYKPHLVTSYKITGGDDSVHDIRGGTLQVWASSRCGTAWVTTVKLAKYSKQPYLTVASITSYDDKNHRWNAKKQTETTTRFSVESPTVTTGGVSELHVEGGFVGPYQFDSAHTFRH